MSKRLNSKYKIDRRLGVNLWGRPKSPINRRETGPGQHGTRRKKPTDFGVQLMAKQKLKGYYGNIRERRFRRYYREAARGGGDTGQALLGALESRLDVVVYRAKFAPTVFSARQLVSHGHIRVNGSRVTISSYSLGVLDVVQLDPAMVENALVLEAGESDERSIPSYLEVDPKQMSAKLLRVPLRDEIPYPVQMEPLLVIEYYSR